MTPDEHAEEYRCQFCGEWSHHGDWIEENCPACDEKYDATLAAEEDDS